MSESKETFVGGWSKAIRGMSLRPASMQPDEDDSDCAECDAVDADLERAIEDETEENRASERARELAAAAAEPMEEVDEGALSAMLGVPVEMLRAEVGPNEQAMLDHIARVERVAIALRDAWENQPPGTTYGTVFEHLARAALRQPQTPDTGVGAIFGRWPGDESDEEVADALAAMGETYDQQIRRLTIKRDEHQRTLIERTLQLEEVERNLEAANAHAYEFAQRLEVAERDAREVAQLRTRIRAVVAEHVEATGFHPSDDAEDNVLRLDLGLHEVIAQRDRAVRLHRRALAVNRGLRAKGKRKARRRS